MLLNIHSQIKEAVGKQVVVNTKKSEKFVGTIIWASPDFTMAELKMKDGHIKLITDITIKQISITQ
ncbi:hypothetical protein [Brevibacillus sp. SYSU BS000544]|uniref:hypothetical protein n=1 Tax=Brevibacillus sp. SYSU BS000544 TaxID=3416443 RepID=UPI003CE4D449